MNLLQRCIAVVALAAAPALSQATPVTYDFTIALNVGPLAGNTVGGSFTFDSGSAPSGGGDVFTNALTDFTFTYDGFTWDESIVESALLRFDAAGALTGFGLGTACVGGGCSISQPGDWIMTGGLGSSPAQHIWVYQSLAGGIDGGGTVSFALQQPPTPGTVPEPGSLALGGLALAALGATRARRRTA